VGQSREPCCLKTIPESQLLENLRSLKPNLLVWRNHPIQSVKSMSSVVFAELYAGAKDRPTLRLLGKLPRSTMHREGVALLRTLFLRRLWIAKRQMPLAVGWFHQTVEKGVSCFDPSAPLRTGTLSMNGKIFNIFKASSVRVEPVER
jgi:hypothetical protein